MFYIIGVLFNLALVLCFLESKDLKSIGFKKISIFLLTSWIGAGFLLYDFTKEMYPIIKAKINKENL